MSASRPVGDPTSAFPAGGAAAGGGGRSGWRSRFLVEERYVDAAVRRRTYRWAVVSIGVGILAFDVLLIGVLMHTGPQLLDQPVEQWFNARRSQDATGFMRVLAVVFGPVGMPVIVAVSLVVWIVLARHLWRPLLLLGGMVTGVIAAQTFAPMVRHPRPPIGLMLLGPDHTFSFPSGHVLGMSDFFLITAYLLASRVGRRSFTVTAAVIAVAGVLAQVVSRLYLGYHWLTDVSASVALSLVILGVIVIIDTRRTVLVAGEPIRGARSTPQVDGT